MHCKIDHNISYLDISQKTLYLRSGWKITVMFLAPGLHTNFISPPSIKLSSAPPKTRKQSEGQINRSKYISVGEGVLDFIFKSLACYQNGVIPKEIVENCMVVCIYFRFGQKRV